MWIEIKMLFYLNVYCYIVAFDVMRSNKSSLTRVCGMRAPQNPIEMSSFRAGAHWAKNQNFVQKPPHTQNIAVLAKKFIITLSVYEIMNLFTVLIQIF